MDEDRHEELLAVLEKNLEVARDNNRILRGMRRAARFGALVRFVWFIIIVLGLWIGYRYYILPYLASFQAAYGQLPSGIDMSQVKVLLENIQQGAQEAGRGAATSTP